MSWELAIIRVALALLAAALLALAGAFLRLWKQSNPTRQEKHYETVHDHGSRIAGLSMKSDQFEVFMKETKGLPERVAKLEVVVANVHEDTGEIKADVRLMTEAFNKFVRSNGGR